MKCFIVLCIVWIVIVNHIANLSLPILKLSKIKTMIEQALRFNGLLYFLNASYYVLNCQVLSQDIHSANPLLTLESFHPYPFLVIRKLFLVFIVNGLGKSVRLLEFRVSDLYFF